ncbi:uncharacterized protein LOC128951904 isoform X2 [Oppia nitens]|uniref:uncharacterized protein LOC128951904 isoform X2 n=1 Tax=Oppia nitens TaxID=1686743 RepID=UPI0023DB9DD2|nr:uncharacterized protein LOC128951904 isoform X2 [Oppia nitens]
MLIFGQLVQIVLLVLISVNILLIKSTTDLCDDTVGTNTTPTPSSSTNPTTTTLSKSTTPETIEPKLPVKAGGNRGVGFTVSLRTNITGRDRHLCSGTIISPHWILTAASCVYNRTVSSIKPDYKHYAVNHTVIYDHYSPETNENNIALVRLKDYIVDNTENKILSLGDQPVANWSVAYLHDWEPKNYRFVTNINSRTIDWKHCTTIIVSDNNTNTNTTTKTPILNSNNICLLTAKGEGVCHKGYVGDVGGAVSVENPDDNNNNYRSRKTRLIGILSADLSCGQLDGGVGRQPKVVTSIAPFLQWINEKTNITAISSSNNNNNNTDNRPVICSTKFEDRSGYSASIRNEFNERLCGGSIIGTNWILTAASCLHNRSLSNIYVGVGDEDFIHNHSYYGVDQIIIHDQYSPVTKQNNIALVRVQPYISDNSRVSIVGLADKLVIYDTTIASMTYWSNITSGTSNVRTVGWQQCKSIMTNNITYNINNDNNTIPVIDSNNLCLVNYYKEIACNGDVGGPVILDIPQQQQQQQQLGNCHGKNDGLLIGILSDNLLCGSNRPTIMTSIGPYLQWINQKTNITAVSNNSHNNTWNSLLANYEDRHEGYWKIKKFGLGFPASLMTISKLNEHFCSGSIIGTNWILTAASCLHNRNVSSIKVFVKHYAINHTVIYDHYSPETNENNIALVRLKDYIVDNPLIEILSLADQPVANWSLAYLHDWDPKLFRVNWMKTIKARTIDWKHCTTIIVSDNNNNNNTNTTNNNTKAITKTPILNSNNICLLTAKGQGVCRVSVK